MPAPTTCPPLRKDATPKDLLRFLAQHGHTGRLTLIFAPGLGLSLDLAQGRLVALGGPLAPRISAALRVLNLPAHRMAAWKEALALGVRPWRLPEGSLVQRMRFVAALSPFWEREAAFRFQERTWPVEGPPLEDLGDLVEE